MAADFSVLLVRVDKRCPSFAAIAGTPDLTAAFVALGTQPAPAAPRPASAPVASPFPG